MTVIVGRFVFGKANFIQISSTNDY